VNSGTKLPIAALCFGVVATVVGLILAGMYILEAVIGRRGEPDQSLLFWYLPILFIGVASVVAGLAASLWGFVRLRRAP
jgi:hypothetical protein